MTYEEVLTAIHSRKAFSTGGPTLDRIGRLMHRLGDPQEDFKTVHVAGTNGKGSCCAMVDAALRENGYQTGLFTSPYLKNFRERIRINGRPISKELLICCYETVIEQQTAIEQEGYEPINEFELVTAIAFVAYSRAKMDYVVLEVGLGGRTDPTNLVSKPAASVIMPISLDHTAVLGNTVGEIAAEKAGIIKKDVPVVTSKQTTEAMDVIYSAASRVGVEVFEAEEVIPLCEEKDGSDFLCGNINLDIPLLGEHQMENAAAAWKVCEVLGIGNEESKKAFRNVSWPGRLQYFPGKPEFLVDAGHNRAGVAALCIALQKLFSGQKVISIMAMMKDKDYEFCIPAIAGRSKAVIGTTVGLLRSLTPEQVAEEAGKFCPSYAAQNMRQAIEQAKAIAEEDDLILICGSVYAAGDALLVLEGE